MTVTTAPRADVDLLVLTAEEILSAATDEAVFLPAPLSFEAKCVPNFA